MSTERQQEQPFEDTAQTSLEEDTGGDQDTVPGRSDSGSTHPEPNPTGNVGLSDYSVSDDPDQG